MPNEEGTEVPQSAIPEVPGNSLPVETPPSMPQTSTAEHAKGFKALIAKIQGMFGGRRESSPTANVQPSMSSELPSTTPTQPEAPQPLTPPTPGTPTT